MKMKLVVGGLLVLAGVGAGTDLLACGNKFLLVSRGTRFGKVAAARHPAAILLYVNRTSALPEALGKVPVEAILSKAGYQPTTVSDPAELEQALRQGGWDLVLADLADSAALHDRLQGDGAPMVVPVVYRPARGVEKQAKKDYGRVLRAPFKGQRLLETIDDAVAIRVELLEKAEAAD